MDIKEHKKKQFARRLRTCKHFAGCVRDVCDAGVPIDMLIEKIPPGTDKRGSSDERLAQGVCMGKIPNGEGDSRICWQHALHTEQELLEADAFIENKIDMMMKCRDAICVHIELTGLMVGEIECPVCVDGRLRYSQAESNKHIHASCTTENCVSWME